VSVDWAQRRKMYWEGDWPRLSTMTNSVSKQLDKYFAHGCHNLGQIAIQIKVMHLGIIEKPTRGCMSCHISVKV